MRKEGLAAQTFRSFTKLDDVFRDMKSYVNMNIGTWFLDAFAIAGALTFRRCDVPRGCEEASPHAVRRAP